MMTFEKIKKLNELEILADLQNGDPTSYFSLREDILAAFGLPNSIEYTSLLEFDNVRLTDFEIEKILSSLHKAANKYLTESTPTDFQLLFEARNGKKSPFEVLPKIDVETHVYTIFIYNEYLLKERDTIDSILQVLKLTNNEGVLHQLGTIEQANDDQIRKLEESGLKYVQEFANNL